MFKTYQLVKSWVTVMDRMKGWRVSSPVTQISRLQLEIDHWACCWNVESPKFLIVVCWLAGRARRSDGALLSVQCWLTGRGSRFKAARENEGINSNLTNRGNAWWEEFRCCFVCFFYFLYNKSLGSCFSCLVLWESLFPWALHRQPLINVRHKTVETDTCTHTHRHTLPSLLTNEA